jgi:hypothetical protein
MTLADAINKINAGEARWIDTMLAYGYGFHVSIGAFSTPITGGGNGTVLDLDQPEGVVSVPSGWCMRPFRVHVQTQTPMLATDADESEILIACDLKNEWYGDGTLTLETPYNLRTDRVAARGTAPLAGCPMKCASAVTGDLTIDGTNDPTHDIDLAHSVIVGDVQGTPATALWTKQELLYEPLYPPFLVGPCSMWLYWGGTVATTGFAQIQFVAFPSSFVTSLA